MITQEHKGSPFYEKKGQPLANEYRGCIWAIMGDAEFAANCLGLPHWASTHLCAECDATSNQEHLAKRFKNIEIDTQEFERVSYAEALANPCSSNKLFHSIPGCTVKTRCCLGEGGDASLVQCELRNVGHAEGTGQWKCIRSSLGRWLCRNLRPSQRRGQFACAAPASKRGSHLQYICGLCFRLVEWFCRDVGQCVFWW